jgi:hypothetical protein
MVIEHLGTNHADEITLSSETQAQDTFPLTAGNGALPQSVIEPLANDLTRHALDALGIPHIRDNDVHHCIFPGGDHRSDLLCWFRLQGDNRMLFKLVCTFDAQIPQRKWAPALRLCNSYHAVSRFGRAYLDFGENESDARFFFESQIDMTEAATEAFLKSFIESNLASAVMFYRMAYEDKGLSLTHPKKRGATKRQEVTTP